MGGRPKQTFLQRRHTGGQEAHGKMLNIHIIREMQIKTTISSQTNQEGHHQKVHKQ